MRPPPAQVVIEGCEAVESTAKLKKAFRGIPRRPETRKRNLLGCGGALSRIPQRDYVPHRSAIAYVTGLLFHDAIESSIEILGVNKKRLNAAYRVVIEHVTTAHAFEDCRAEDYNC